MRANTERGKLADRLFHRDIIAKSDHENTEELIKITDIYGFPWMDRFDLKFPVCLVFVHSPQEYFPDIIKLVERKHKLGNMNDWERDYILWHVKRDREGFWSRADKAIWFGNDEDIMNYFLK